MPSALLYTTLLGTYEYLAVQVFSVSLVDAIPLDSYRRTQTLSFSSSVTPSTLYTVEEKEEEEGDHDGYSFFLLFY